MPKPIMFCFIIFFGLSAFANEIWETNKDHSEISFKVPYMGVSEVSGRFNEFKGKAQFPDNQSLPSSLRVTIESHSIDTGNKMRDGHLRGNYFFKSKDFPQMDFKSTSIKETNKGEFEAQGILTIKGISNPVTVFYTMTENLKDTWGYDNKFVKFQFTIKRLDYGIQWNKTLDGKKFLVGDDIFIKGNFQIQPLGKKTPNSKHMIPDTDYIRKRDLERLKKK